GGATLVVFFQAEDGIRDFHVTGVQTCALPISGEARTPGRQLSPLETCAGPDPATPPVRRTTRRGAMLLRKIIGPVGTFGLAAVRSEERRVGNEGRAGGSRGVQMGQVQSGEERE